VKRATAVSIKEKFDSALTSLPPEGLEELSRYLDRLASKYHVAQGSEHISLSGLWQEIPLDIEDSDVRALRRSVTDSLVDEA
jgi:hypothetical protein